MYGAILGDIIGSPFEFDRGNKTKDFELFTRGCDCQYARLGNKISTCRIWWQKRRQQLHITIQRESKEL